jgi:hypothetical protein
VLALTGEAAQRGLDCHKLGLVGGVVHFRSERWQIAALLAIAARSC